MFFIFRYSSFCFLASSITCLLMFSGSVYSNELIRATENTLNVLTYNVLKHDQSIMAEISAFITEPLPTMVRVSQTLEYLKDQKVDIIALQEVTPSFLKALEQQPWTEGYHLTHTLTKSQLTDTYHMMEPYGQIILSRFPFLNTQVLTMKRTHLNRKLLLAEINIQSHRLMVANVHLDSLPEDRKIRVMQLQQTFKSVQYADNALVLGDFNFADQQQPESSFLPKDFSDPWLCFYPDKPGFTYLSSNGKGKRFDRFLFRSHFLQATGIIKLDEPTIEYEKNDILLSDHRPLILNLRGFNQK